ncbi:hypothetical protein V6N12_007346 [Hibiscus sabdariffa]|uniref:Uncharacterized protein n=1 Tax=Hibiscus sabdariffa TaxID=183260 RepID=A0ABR2F1H6_9ROSI
MRFEEKILEGLRAVENRVSSNIWVVEKILVMIYDWREWLELRQQRRSACMEWSRGVHLPTSRWPCSACAGTAGMEWMADLLAWNG